MADKEHVIVGAPHVVCVVKRPSPMPSKKEDRQLLANLPILGHHREDIITMVAAKKIPRLRKLGAEVTVIDDDPNAYAARVEAAETPEDLIAAIDERVAKAREDMAVAQAGDDTEKNGKA